MPVLKTLAARARPRLGPSSVLSSSGALVSGSSRPPLVPSHRLYSDKIDPLPRQTYTSKSTNPNGPRYPPPNPTGPPPQSARAEQDPQFAESTQSQPEAPEKETAWDRYLQRGLPNWAIGCMFAYLLYMYGFEKAAQWGWHEGADYADRARKMERATAARDAYFAQLAEEKVKAKELLEADAGKEKVAGVLLPVRGEQKKV